MSPWLRLSLFAALLFALTACSTFRPPADVPDFAAVMETQTQVRDGIRVSAWVMSRTQTREAFGKRVDKAGVQPVWLEIENTTDKPYWLVVRQTGPNFYPAFEVASLAHGRIGAPADSMLEYFDDAHIDRFILPGETRSGYVFTRLKLGTKEVRVQLLAEQKIQEFEFFIAVPGLKADWQQVDFFSIYPPEDILDYTDGAELRGALEAFMCCTTRQNGSGSGDPINMVVISSGESLANFVRAGWDETEVINIGSMWRTAKAFLTSGEYKYSPISALYVFDRPQDISLQKARDTIHERNHLRLWLAPFTYRGTPVWMGAISRDIGVFWTTRTWNLTTHAIDSEVDEARNYITEDLANSGGLTAFGLVGGVGLTTRDDPQENLLGTPWWTDGRRVVLLLSEEPTPLEEIDILDWTLDN